MTSMRFRAGLIEMLRMHAGAHADSCQRKYSPHILKIPLRGCVADETAVFAMHTLRPIMHNTLLRTPSSKTKTPEELLLLLMMIEIQKVSTCTTVIFLPLSHYCTAVRGASAICFAVSTNAYHGDVILARGVHGGSGLYIASEH